MQPHLHSLCRNQYLLCVCCCSMPAAYMLKCNPQEAIMLAFGFTCKQPSRSEHGYIDTAEWRHCFNEHQTLCHTACLMLQAHCECLMAQASTNAYAFSADRIMHTHMQLCQLQSLCRLYTITGNACYCVVPHAATAFLFAAATCLSRVLHASMTQVATPPRCYGTRH